jgi:hypothetical protein
LLELYGRFIERKYDIYQEEKLQVPVNNAAAIEQRERDLKIMKEYYQLLAFKVLFTEEQVAFLQNNSQCSFSAEELTRIGIVQVGHDGKPHFIHRTFAEFYVADCLVNRLTEGNNISEQVLSFVLKDIFQKDEYQVIRAFIDNLLKGSKISKEMLKQYGKGIHDLGKCAVLMLHRAAEEENVNIVALLIDSLQTSDHTDTLRQLLLAQNIEGKSAYFMATESGNLQVLEKLWEYAKEKLTTEDINNKILLARYNEGMTVLHKAACGGKLDVLLKIWDWAEEKLNTQEISKKLILATDHARRTAWHWAVCMEKLDIMQQVWEWAEEKLTREEINNKLLLATDNAGMTAWHWAARRGTLEILQKIWEWTKSKITTEDINSKLLLATDIRRMTAWHCAACWGNLDILLKVWEWAEEKLTTEDINSKLILATNN